MAHKHVTLNDAEIDKIDSLPNPGPPKPGVPALSLVSLQLIAEVATRAGLSCIDANRHEDANDVVRTAADAVNPLNSSDDSPGAWARRGAYAGIVCAWEGGEYRPPELRIGDLELFAAAWTVARMVAIRVRAMEGGR